MNDFERSERLTALAALGFVKGEVAKYTLPEDQHAAAESVLILAAEYASTGADLTVLKVLEYPEVKA